MINKANEKTIGFIRSESGLKKFPKKLMRLDRTAKAMFKGSSFDLFFKIINSLKGNESLVIKKKTGFISSEYGLVDFSAEIDYYQPTIPKSQVKNVLKLSQELGFEKIFIKWTKGLDYIFILLNRQYLKFCSFRHMKNFPIKPIFVFIGTKESKGLVPRSKNVYFIRSDSSKVEKIVPKTDNNRNELILKYLLEKFPSNKWMQTLKELKAQSNPFFDNPDNYLNELSGRDWLLFSKSIWRMENDCELFPTLSRIFRRSNQPCFEYPSSNPEYPAFYVHVPARNKTTRIKLHEISKQIKHKGYLTIECDLLELEHEKIIEELKQMNFQYQDMIVIDKGSHVREENSQQFNPILKGLNLSQEEKTRHPAQFSERLVRFLIQDFSSSQECILDPFVGSGTVVKCALEMDRLAIGIDLVSDYLEVTRSRLNLDTSNYLLIQGDSRSFSKDKRILKWLGAKRKKTVRLIITSPPYWDVLNKRRKKTVLRQHRKEVLQYSKLESDIGNIDDYECFLKELALVLKEAYSILSTRGKIAIVIMDIRKKNKVYPFHLDIKKICVQLGFVLKALFIWDRDPEYNFLRPIGYPTTFIINRIHEFVLVFEKTSKESEVQKFPYKCPLKGILLFRKGS